MDLELQGKTAIVTGGSKGIGRAIALSLASEGVSIATCARDETSLNETAAEIASFGVTAHTMACDISNPAALDSFLDSACSEFGMIDILINNVSGMGGGRDSLDAWKDNIQLDLMSSVRASNHIAPIMRSNGGGNIVFISSIAALKGGGSIPYSAVKAALVSYSKNLSLSLASDHIRVNTVAPGSVEFAGGVWARAKEQTPERYHAALRAIPFRRMGRPEEIADIVTFVVSKRASWLTGACLSVDGGQHKGNL